MVRLLEESQSEFLKLTAEVSDAQWTAKSTPESWSVQQIAEHLVLGELGMLTKIQEALANPPKADWEQDDARKARFLDRALPDRRHKVIAPAPLHPRHDWSRAETLSRYQAGRSKTLHFVAGIERPIKSHCSDHPFPIFNSLSAYHWLLYIPLHNTRHNQQIEEVLKELRA